NTSVVVVFGGIANISTDGMPQILFYLAGIIGWNYFSEVFSITSETFVHNAYIFGKVYFPRIIVPLSNVFSNLITFGVQFLLFLLIYGYYYFFQESQIYPNLTVLLTPILVLITGGLGLGLGLIFTSLTTKYRDFTYVTGFGIQLAMYATPIIYPTSLVEGNMKILILANPMSSVIEAFRYSFLGVGSFSWTSLVYSFVAMFLILIVGFVVFNKVEKNFIDTV
ncbi:MAG: ABC transporter permease, partial [Bacteroidota bacterium]